MNYKFRILCVRRSCSERCLYTVLTMSERSSLIRLSTFYNITIKIPQYTFNQDSRLEYVKRFDIITCVLCHHDVWHLHSPYEDVFQMGRVAAGMCNS
jgi:hypothetical protein